MMLQLARLVVVLALAAGQCLATRADNYADEGFGEEAPSLIRILSPDSQEHQRFARSAIKSPASQRFRGGGYSVGTPISPSRARGGAAGYSGAAAGGAYAGAGAAAGGGFGGGAGAGSYGGGDDEHLAPEPYNFQYAAPDEYGNNQYRNEEQDQSGTIRGSYGYTDANGLYRVVDYVADNDGFRASIRSNEPGGLTEPNPTTGAVDQPADVNLQSEPVPAAIRQQQESYAKAGAGAHASAAAAAGGARYRAGGVGGQAGYGGGAAGGFGGGARGGFGGSAGGYSGSAGSGGFGASGGHAGAGAGGFGGHSGAGAGGFGGHSGGAGSGYGGGAAGGFGGHSGGGFGGSGFGGGSRKPITQQKLPTYSEKY